MNKTGVRQATYSILKERLFSVAGSTEAWTEMRIELGIATTITNLYPKEAVLLIGFILEGSVVAMKIRNLVLEDSAYGLFGETEPEQEQYAYQMPVAIPDNRMSTIVVEPTAQKKHNDMQVVNHDAQLVIDSRDVAEMVGKNHKEVIRDIRTIIEHLGGERKIALSYFIESTYTNTQNKQLPCYQLTKKGCELFATRMTGAKGTQFAVTYIEKFNQMEEQIKSQIPIASYTIDNPIERAKQWVVEQEQKMLLEVKVQEQVVVIEKKQ